MKELAVGFGGQFCCRCGSFFFSPLLQSSATSLFGIPAVLSTNRGEDAQHSHLRVKLHGDRNLAASVDRSAEDPCVRIRFCRSWATYLASVEANQVRSTFVPREALARVKRQTEGKIQEDALQIVTLLSASAHIAWIDFGLTGSLEGGYERESSDVDIVVYGRENAIAVKQAMLELIAEGVVSIPGPRSSWHVDVPFRDFLMGHTGLESSRYTEALHQSRRLYFKGLYRGRKFDLYFVDELLSGPRLDPSKSIEVREGCELVGEVVDGTSLLLLPSRFTLAVDGLTTPLPVYSLLNASRLLREGEGLQICGNMVREEGGEETLVLTDGARHWVRLLTTLSLSAKSQP